jgi:hypothetical protein
MRLAPRLPSAFAALVLACTLMGANPARAADGDATQQTPSALSTDSTGWENILPPTDLKGWLDVPIPTKAKLKRAQWHVDNGKLVCDGDGGHDMLLLDRRLRNCIFHVEYCFTKIEDKKGYNSGVFIRTSRDGAIWYQAQVQSLAGGYWFGVNPTGTTTKKFHVETKPCRVTEAGEWNTYELTAQGHTLTLWINGYITAVFSGCGADDGYIALEGEGSHITFRNLKLKVLP